MISITTHAIERYQERVANVPEAEARAALSSAAVEKAAEIGAPFVKLGTGQHIVIRSGTVVTVFPKEKRLSSLCRCRDPENRIPTQGEV